MPLTRVLEYIVVGSCLVSASISTSALEVVSSALCWWRTEAWCRPVGLTSPSNQNACDDKPFLVPMDIPHIATSPSANPKFIGSDTTLETPTTFKRRGETNSSNPSVSLNFCHCPRSISRRHRTVNDPQL